MRVDARLGRETVDWAVMVKATGQNNRWERWAIAPVVFEGDDYMDAMRQAAYQVQGHLGASGRS